MAWALATPPSRCSLTAACSWRSPRCSASRRSRSSAAGCRARHTTSPPACPVRRWKCWAPVGCASTSGCSAPPRAELASRGVQPEHHLVDEAPAPVLARLDRTHDWVAARDLMRARMLVRRVVAAADVAAGLAHAQVLPALLASREAVLAADDRLGRGEQLDGVEMATGRGHPGE